MGENMREQILSKVRQIIEDAVDSYCGNGDAYLDWDMTGLTEYLEKLCVRAGFIEAHMEEIKKLDKSALKELLTREANDFYAQREASIAEIGLDMREL